MDWNPGPYKMPDEAIVLAGGFGTRLKTVVKELPKPMAPINDVPFLSYLLSMLLRQGITRTVLSVGYLHETIEDYFGDNFKGMELVYALEVEPLGTGGGVRNALKQARSENVFLVNGDTFFDVNLKLLSEVHLNNSAQVTFSLKPMHNFDRYGSVDVLNAKIVAFNEKQFLTEGLINGGVYCIKTNIFEHLSLPEKFSLEQDYFEKYCQVLNFACIETDSYFVDIGIPEDYKRAQTEIPALKLLK